MRIILIAILIYVAYQFIFNFIIPLYIAASRMKKGFKEMRSRMETYQSATNRQDYVHASSQKEGNKMNNEDYLDFEEVK